MEKGFCRVAPSNTGTIHVGTARTAIYSYLHAMQKGMGFLIRMEDTDQARSTQEFADNILEGLAWLGITSDIPVVYQSSRSEIYTKYVNQLLKEGKAYKCYCTSEELEEVREAQLARKEKPLYMRTCFGVEDKPGQPFVVRLKTEDFGSVQFKDAVYGRVNIRKSEISDFIIQRRDGSVGYLLANVIDDALQKVSTIIRGKDGLSNAPAQILLYEALGFPVPTYAHSAFILNEAGEKLSKRNGDASLLDYKAKGFLPEAMVNALARIGWSAGNSELMDMRELIEKFNLNHVGKSDGAFDQQKLLHINSHWIKNGDPDRLAELLMPFLTAEGVTPEQFKKVYVVDVVKTLQTRAKTLVEMAGMAKFYYQRPRPSAWGGAFSDEDKARLDVVCSELAKRKHTPEGIGEAVKSACEKCTCTIKEIGPAIRLALTGSTCAPGVYEMIYVLGITEVLERIDTAIALP